MVLFLESKHRKFVRMTVLTTKLKEHFNLNKYDRKAIDKYLDNRKLPSQKFTLRRHRLLAHPPCEWFYYRQFDEPLLEDLIDELCGYNWTKKGIEESLNN